MSKRKQAVKFVTPRGTASYPHINRPDEYKGKKSYNCKLIFDPSADFEPKKTKKGPLSHADEVAQFVAKYTKFIEAQSVKAVAELQELLEPIADSKAPKQKKVADGYRKLISEIEEGEYRNPLEEIYDEDTGEPTGTFSMNFKSNTEWKNRDGEMMPINIYVYDTTPALLEEPPEIKGGAILRIESAMTPYAATGGIGAGVSAKLNSVQIIQLSSYGAGAGFDAEDGFESEEGDEEYTEPTASFDEDDFDYS